MAEVLQTIISHRSDGEPLSVEAGVVRVADALDMAKGRSRIPFETGRVSIHSLSAAAIEAVNIRSSGTGKVLVEIVLNNSAGLFQVDNLLKSKLHGSGLESHIEVEADIEGETEKRLLGAFRLGLRVGPQGPITPLVRCAGPLRGRLMVGRLTLDQVVGVRVPAPQPRYFPPAARRAHLARVRRPL